MKVLDILMWISFLVSLVFTFISTLVIFHIQIYIKMFATLLPVEISLAATFFIWGINSLYNQYTRNSRLTFLFSIILGGILLVFAAFGIY